ncbi:hypothetical protein [Amycolatopsis sp. NPDC051061]|uniref:hypothetical protein n=1 Tax=Amycolatopsis sp. NPDC051061 TaxID=3155042 RepID=UPI003436EE9F
MRLVLPLVLLAAVGCAGCTARPAASGAPAGSSAQQRPAGTTTRVPVTTVAPRSPAQSGVTVVPPLSPATPPAPGDPAVFATAQAVGVEWLRQWCAVDWREPMNANLDRAARFQTAAAARADRRDGDDENTYRSAREQQLISACDRITATESPEAPHSAEVAYLIISARRVDSASGTAFEDRPVQSVRRVVRQPDGRWLVDEQVEAG